MNELIPSDCNRALAGVAKQLQRGIDEPEYRDGAMRVKRMVRTLQLIHDLLVYGDSAVNCSEHAQCYLGEAMTGVHLSYTTKQLGLQLVKQSDITALDCLFRHHMLMYVLVTYVYICLVSRCH